MQKTVSEWKHPVEPRLRYVLFPLAMLYWGILFWRNLFYNMGFFVSRKLPTKVISVGNITTGGTGKTPAVIYLARLLSKKGKTVAVLSRGYGRKTAGTQLVTDGMTPVTDWRNFGDEATLLAKALPGIPILVDENRHRGGLFLVDRFKPDVIIMDDAFQHRAIERDIDIVLINSQDSRQTHKLLPYGFLREPWIQLRRAHVLIFTKTNLKKPAPFLRSLARSAKLPRFRSVLMSGEPTSCNGQKRAAAQGTKVFALSAVGDHGGFIRSLKKLGLNVVDEMVFIDHHDYTKADVIDAKRRFSKSKADFVITTEKDMVKLEQLGLAGFNLYSIGAEFKLSQQSEKRLLDIIVN
ncbi:MAG: tetraacyldisaccharide 4'-kinase [Candidatus Marinimicrobia bacterium]|nr:tetraacyldisaccharide 4'-kinase [Candidatus Neomarinimicrobiota bacterium]